MNLLDKINKDNLPKHLAIIMDGNGRWAKQKGLLRAFGHENGTKAVRQVVEASAKLGITIVNAIILSFSSIINLIYSGLIKLMCFLFI